MGLFAKAEKPQFEVPKGFTITAHSGCMDMPDNSVEAMTKGVEAGADIIEVDLRYDEDGEPVLAHDDPVGGEISLATVFAFLERNPDVMANIDVKDTEHLENVAAMAESFEVGDRIFFTGVYEQDVPAVRKKCPGIPYYLNIELNNETDEEYLGSVSDAVRRTQAVGINSNYGKLTAELTSWLHERGQKVSVWTVNDGTDIKKLLSFGVDNITSRRPDIVAELCGRNREI